MLADPFDLTQLKKSLPKLEPVKRQENPSSTYVTPEPYKPSVTPKPYVQPSPKTSEFKICFKMGSLQQRFLLDISSSIILYYYYCYRNEGTWWFFE